jgi:hypothetical protein
MTSAPTFDELLLKALQQEIEQRSPLERDAAAGAAGRKQPCIGADVTLPEISN